MARADNEVGTEHVLNPPHIRTDLFRCSVCHQVLRVNPSQECQHALEVPGQALGLHVACESLDGMQAIHTSIDHPRDQRVNRSA